MKSVILFREELTVIKTKILICLGIMLGDLGQLFSKLIIDSSPSQRTKVLIEAGKPAWDSVFFVELRESLQDYLIEGEIACSAIEKDKGYLLQAIRGIRSEKVTHYFFDPRTGPQTRLRALFNICVIAFCLGLTKVTPIVILTDGSIRLWRFQAFLLTGRCGVIVTFLDVESMGSLFPHKRVIGPSIMPVSQKRLSKLNAEDVRLNTNTSEFKSVFFLGSLYPERRKFLDELRHHLNNRNCDIDLIVEEKSRNISVEDYWKKIHSYSCLITTTMQQPSSKFPSDRLDLHQMVFRISETLAAGKLLLCPIVPGMKDYFEESRHYVGFVSASEAADKIVWLSKFPDKGKKIAFEGKSRFNELISSFVFWEKINQQLTSKLK